HLTDILCCRRSRLQWREHQGDALEVYVSEPCPAEPSPISGTFVCREGQGLPQSLWSWSKDARHGQWPHAGIHLVRHTVVPYHLRAVIKTAGLALHDEEPERISRLIEETVADFWIGMGRPRACRKCCQRALKPPSKPSER